MLNWPIVTDAHMRKNETTKKCRFQSLQKNAEHQKASHFNFSFLIPQSLLLIAYFPLSISHSTFPISHFSFFILHSCDILFIEAKNRRRDVQLRSRFPILHATFLIPHSPIPHSIFSVLVPSRWDWVVIHCLFAIVLFLWHLKMLLLFEKGFSAFLRHAKSIKYWMLYESYVIFAIWFSFNDHITNFITFAGSLWPRMAKRPWDLKEKRHFPKSHYGTTSWKIAVVIFALSCPVWVTAPMNITRVLTTGSCIERWQNHDHSHAKGE